MYVRLADSGNPCVSELLCPQRKNATLEKTAKVLDLLRNWIELLDLLRNWARITRDNVLHCVRTQESHDCSARRRRKSLLSCGVGKLRSKSSTLHKCFMNRRIPSNSFWRPCNKLGAPGLLPKSYNSTWSNLRKWIFSKTLKIDETHPKSSFWTSWKTRSWSSFIASFREYEHNPVLVLSNPR